MQLMSPNETAALEALSMRDIPGLLQDFTRIFESGDAMLYRDQVLAISGYERLLKIYERLPRVLKEKNGSQARRVALHDDDRNAEAHRNLQAILDSDDTVAKAFIKSRIEVCHLGVQLHREVARRFAIIPVGSLYPGVVNVNADFDNLIRTLCASPRDLYRLEPRRFEELMAELWARMGYAVELTPESRDGGRDIIASKNDETKTQVLIECKKYSPGRPVGVAVVQRMLGVIAHYEATQGVIATTSTFTREAIKVIAANEHRLTGHGIRDLINLLWRVQMVMVPRIPV
jgi:hypothetical protein